MAPGRRLRLRPAAGWCSSRRCTRSARSRSARASSTAEPGSVERLETGRLRHRGGAGGPDPPRRRGQRALPSRRVRASSPAWTRTAGRTTALPPSATRTATASCCRRSRSGCRAGRGRTDDGCRSSRRASAARPSVRHGAFEAVAPPHDWWDWYAAYMDAREGGSSSGGGRPPPRTATWRRSRASS